MTAEDVRVTVARLLDEEPDAIAADTNLFELGLDSIDLMEVVNGWRRSGREISFADLATEPTLAAWERLLDKAQPGAPAGNTADAAATAGSADPGGPFPLGLMQHAYWIGREDGQRLGGVAAHLYTEFDGAALDPGRLTVAILGLAARHDMLRVRLTDNGEQVVGPQAGWTGLTVHDLRHAGEQDAERRLGEIRDRLSHQRLDIEAGIVFAAELSLLPGGRGRFHLDVDMVAADAASYRLLLAELARRYAEPGLQLPPVGYSYRRYRAERPAARAAAAERAAAWWRRRLADLPEGPRLPLAEHPDPAPRVRRRHLWLAEPDRAKLAAAAQRRGITSAAAVATVFAETIGAWSAQPRFLLNVPLFDRVPLHDAVDEVVGDFSSSVMLDVDLTGPATFTERARRLQARMHTDVAYADHSGLDVLRDLSRLRGRQILAPVVYTSALNLGELFDERVRATFGDPVWIVSQGPQVLLDAQVTELSGGILVNWDCREEQFAGGVLDAMFAWFERLLRDLVADGPAWDAPVPAPEGVAAGAVAAGVDGGGPAGDAGRAPGRAPATDLERAIALVWTELLDTPGLGADDDFFALGGDSVVATAIVTRLREGLETEAMSVRALFAAPTVAGLANRLLEQDARLEEVAAVFLEIEALSDDEVRAQLEEESTR